jgi:Tfp pilus assembly protein PilO
MFRFIMPIIILGIAIAVFFTFANPIYTEISTLKAQSASYDEALNNSKALETERDKLTQKYNEIAAENLDRLNKMLPENVDNIRLILEIEKLATPYGMVLKDVKYDTTEEETPKVNAVTPGNPAPSARKEYGTWELEFSTTGTYPNFLNFLRSLEKNLRIVDISSVEFSSPEGSSTNTVPAYNYKFKIRTYWLKN